MKLSNFYGNIVLFHFCTQLSFYSLRLRIASGMYVAFAHALTVSIDVDKCN